MFEPILARSKSVLISNEVQLSYFSTLLRFFTFVIYATLTNNRN
ncbi:hypothetical protein X808_1460 [Mannheimia varigena USDA-ARS-USMARC-1296]|uniref:Uncharacterized protein n=1 Tax=Mannheimia varigena USDA-ARS-USMARC-1296 TaxID=1433287 RepID=W0QBR0_9PAST|nr:hypothetical protein X808_1460 [Mannheimia varigena USDA-ARS-USMARC-1296]